MRAVSVMVIGKIIMHVGQSRMQQHAITCEVTFSAGSLEGCQYLPLAKFKSNISTLPGIIKELVFITGCKVRKPMCYF
jgi:hypothetical protein